MNALAVDGLLLAVAQAEYSGVASLEEARNRCKAFTLDELLDVSNPGWATQEKAQRHMGEMSNRLWWVTYACFTNNECGGVPIEYPEDFYPKSVSLADTFEVTKIASNARAFLALSGHHDEPVLVRFPTVERTLLKPGKGDDFATSETAFRRMLLDLLDRVNLIVPAARLLDAADNSPD